MKKDDSSSKIIDLKPRSRSSARSKGLSKIEYQETLSAPLWLRVLVYGFFGIMIGFYLLSPIWDTESNDVLNLSLCLVFVFVLWVLHIFLSLRVTLSAKGIQFGYYLLSKQFKYRDGAFGKERTARSCTTSRGTRALPSRSSFERRTSALCTPSVPGGRR